jgi:DNA polymerase-3 subunit gamma/tau
LTTKTIARRGTPVARTKPSTDGGAMVESAPAPLSGDDASRYLVVARRYRPQTFNDVVGQDHVVQALRNAIRMNRVTHAYLFSGTRGVGKTSIARIFAKCLNCVNGPTDTPCNTCDICQAISTGQDVDVIEIDGASNNGVEQVRELRQNAGLRPSRSRFKIYYIDEVHMLSTGAFNALLKTLEEPPEHVKFFFSTTEPNKIPITVLSRCQRYDFAGIAPEQIIESLAGICQREGVQADRDALQAVARRAGGSMRDAQSLLEQLLSFGGKHLTSELVHQALGIAPDDRVLDLVDALAEHDAGRALQLLSEAVHGGVQPVDLLNGLIEFLRDVMVISAGAEVDALAAAPSQRPRLRSVADRWPIDTVLAAMQILSETRARLRGSAHGRIWVEVALCRIARLEDFAEVAQLLAALGGVEAGGASASPKKKADGALTGAPPAPSAAPPRRVEPPVATPAPPAPAPVIPAPPIELPDLEAVARAWSALPAEVGAVLGMRLVRVKPTAVERPDRVVVAIPSRYNDLAELIDTAETRVRIDAALTTLLGRPLRVEFIRGAAEEPEPLAAGPSAAERADELTADPLVKSVAELFEARRVRVELEDDAPAG